MPYRCGRARKLPAVAVPHRGNPNRHTGRTPIMFSDPEEHAENPPSTWTVVHDVRHGEDRYRLVTATGRALDSFALERVAREHLTSGYLVEAYEREGRWFAGETDKHAASWAEVQANRASAGVVDDDPQRTEARRVVRHFQKFTPEQRANRAASHRLTYGQRAAVGEFFFTHPDVPGSAFDTRGSAARAAVQAASKRRCRVEMFAAKLAAETIRNEDNPRPVDPTDDVLAKMFEDCVKPAPVEMYDEIRAAYAKFVAAWEDERYEAAKARYAALQNRPDVAAVAARLATLTDEELRHLDAAYRQHFRLYRSAQSELAHRCGRAYSKRVGDKYGFRDVLYVAGQVAWNLQPDDPSSFGRNAAKDYVKALLWGDLLAEHERPIFTGPWVSVIGEGGPRAELPKRDEAYVSPWALV